MKRILLSLLILCLAVAAGYASNGYSIKIKISGLSDTTIYLGNHYGDKQYVRDTVRTNAQGWAEFKGAEKLPGGIYLVVMPTKTYFEILVTENEQNFTIETDTLDFVNNFVVKGSQENKMFNEHQRLLIQKTKESQSLRARMDANKENADSSAILKEKILALDKEVKDYRLNLMKNYPESFMTKIFNAMKEPEIPEPPRDANGVITDSLFQFRFFKSHFWDTYDFSDDRLLRTPILQNKIKQYTQQLTVPHPDSIIKSLHLIIEKARANQEVFKYCVITLANFYETSNIMGYDKIFVDLAERYYLTKEAFWADSTTLAKIEERVNKIKPNILGTPAYNLIMPDTSLRLQRLYDVKADYTVIAFWDPTCGHCKKEIPMLSHYRDSIRAAGINLEVFSVGIESDIELWKKFIRENDLKWINVSDLYNNTNFRNYYDIYSTPVIYLLDNKKQIIAKRLDTEKLRDFIENQRKNADKK